MSTKESKSILKRLLEERGLTVQQFAEQTGLSKRTLDTYIRGAKSFHKRQAWFLMAISDALHIDPHILLENQPSK